MSYSDLVFANDYFTNHRLASERWFEEASTNRQIALNEAVILLDSLNYLGSKTDINQPNEFPRNDDTVVPLDIKRAECEIAINLLDGRDVEMEAENTDATAASFGGGTLRFDSTVVNQAKIHSIPSIKAWMLIRPYLRAGDTIVMSRVS